MPARRRHRRGTRATRPHRHQGASPPRRPRASSPASTTSCAAARTVESHAALGPPPSRKRTTRAGSARTRGPRRRSPDPPVRSAIRAEGYNQRGDAHRRRHWRPGSDPGSWQRDTHRWTHGRRSREAVPVRRPPVGRGFRSDTHRSTTQAAERRPACSTTAATSPTPPFDVRVGMAHLGAEPAVPGHYGLGQLRGHHPQVAAAGGPGLGQSQRAHRVADACGRPGSDCRPHAG